MSDSKHRATIVIDFPFPPNDNDTEYTKQTIREELENSIKNKRVPNLLFTADNLVSVKVEKVLPPAERAAKVIWDRWNDHSYLHPRNKEVIASIIEEEYAKSV